MQDSNERLGQDGGREAALAMRPVPEVRDTQARRQQAPIAAGAVPLVGGRQGDGR